MEQPSKPMTLDEQLSQLQLETPELSGLFGKMCLEQTMAQRQIRFLREQVIHLQNELSKTVAHTCSGCSQYEEEKPI